MKKQPILIACILLVAIPVIVVAFFSRHSHAAEQFLKPDLAKMPTGKFGEAVKYGRALFLNTARYIGPKGSNGKYLGNKMNCTNCHQEAGTKPFSFNLMLSHSEYPQYRAREGKILTLADRINNCIERPHNGKPLPPDSKEMLAFLSYLKWINSYGEQMKNFNGVKNLEISFPPRAASSQKGSELFQRHCQTCHGRNGEGQFHSDSVTYVYPPLWGATAYQRGSSMHRVIKLAQWLKGNMPLGTATPAEPFLSDEDALDIAAFINDDRIHARPYPNSSDYPHPEEKAIDYDQGPFIDSFSSAQHKFGPYPPIINYWKSRGRRPVY